MIDHDLECIGERINDLGIDEGSPLDRVEVVSLISDAAFDYALTADSFGELSAVFQSIQAASEDDTLARRLALLGERLADKAGFDAQARQIKYEQEAERYGH